MINKKPKFSLSESFYPCAIIQDKKVNSEAGFSILEILVTILVISGFLLGSLQAIILATLFRIQAQDKQEAANWIQQDLELIKYQAFILDNPLILPDTITPTKANACGNYSTRLKNTIIGSRYTDNQGIEINGKWYRVFREYTSSNNILQVSYTLAYAPAVSPNSAHPRFKTNANYTVTDLSSLKSSGSANILTNLSTEVLPNVALNCP